MYRHVQKPADRISAAVVTERWCASGCLYVQTLFQLTTLACERSLLVVKLTFPQFHSIVKL